MDLENNGSRFSNEPEQSCTTMQKEKQGLLAYLHDIVCLVAGVVLLFSLCFRIVVVSGPSMNNTLFDGDWLLLAGSIFYGEPKQGDVIVASKDAYDSGTPIIKRVIALEGQTVDIDFDQGIVYVDGTALNEPYIKAPTTLDEGMTFPLVVSDGCVFVMGDNRENSKDSRSPQIGLIDKREILGKAIFLFVPGSDGGRVRRDFSRIGGIS